MAKLRLSITMSVDGYVGGPDQSQENPLGVGGMELHRWFFRSGSSETCTARREARSTQALLSWRSGGRTSAPRSWAAICSDRFVGRGRMSRGEAGGARIRPTTIPFSCLPPPTRAAGDAGWYHFLLRQRWDWVRAGAGQGRRARTGCLARGRRIRGQPVPGHATGGRDRHIDRARDPRRGARLFDRLEPGALKLKQIRSVDAPGVTHIKYEVS